MPTVNNRLDFGPISASTRPQSKWNNPHHTTTFLSTLCINACSSYKNSETAVVIVSSSNPSDETSLFVKKKFLSVAVYITNHQSMSQNNVSSPKTSTSINFSHAQSEPDMQKALSDSPGIASSRPKRPRIDTSPDMEHATKPLTEEFLQTIRREIRDVMSTEISKSIKSSIAEELGNLKEAMSLIRKLEESVQFMSDEFDHVKNELQDYKEANQRVLKENELLKHAVSDLSIRVNLLEQNTRQQNIEINGVPENKSENLISTVVQLGKAVSSTLKENCIISAVRVRKLDPQSTSPRAIIVKMNSTSTRDEILASVMNYNKIHPDNKLNSHLLGYGGAKKPIFVSEHLSPLNKQIHAATRKAARAKEYKYVWVRDGRILVRKADGIQAKQVRSLEAVELL